MSILVGAAVEPAVAANLGSAADLTELSIEELMDIEVTSVSKKEEKLSETAAAVFVITGDDLRRSGVTNIPDALRMVPGLHVARIDANKWAISARGFSGRFSNKLLVLIDGRSVYTPIYSGVFWETQDVMLECVDRIEVIRGPGATMWGANAVNGVINIITRHARDTQGGYARVGFGSPERGFSSFRHGAKIGDAGYYRLYAKYFNRDNSVNVTGSEAADGWSAFRGGFRWDWEGSKGNSFTLQGDTFNGLAGETLTAASLTSPYMQTYDADIDIAGATLLGRWRRVPSDASGMALQLYYDRDKRSEPLVRFLRQTVDVDFQQRFLPDRRHEIVWGLGYRITNYDISNAFPVSWEAYSPNEYLAGGFIQDNVTLVRDRLYLAVGSKFEHNDYTGREIQPNARLLWTPHEHHSVWAAVSEAARTPSLSEYYTQFASQSFPPGKYHPDRVTLVTMQGNSEFDSEHLRAYELGYRVRPGTRISLDMSSFRHVYDDLRTLEPGVPYVATSPSPPHLVVPILTDNGMFGETYGWELVADWDMQPWWRLHASYTYLKMRLHLDPESDDIISEKAEETCPNHQFSLRSSMIQSCGVGLTIAYRWIDELPGLNLESYSALDIWLGFHLTSTIEVSLVGQNLLGSYHSEFAPEFYDTVPTRVEREFYGAIGWAF